MMRVLAKANIPFLPEPDDYFGESAGMVKLGGYVIHGMRVQTSDWSAHDYTMVFRSIRVTRSGAQVVSELRIKPPEPGPTGGNGFTRINAMMTMSPLDNSRMLVVITQGRYSDSPGGTDNDVPILVVVVACDSQGQLTQGVPVQVAQSVFVDNALVGHFELSNLNPFPAVAVDSSHVVMFAPCRTLAGEHFTYAATFDVSDMSVGPGVWAFWWNAASVDYAFVHEGRPYSVSSYDGIAGPNGAWWPFRQEGPNYWNQMMRSCRIGATTWLIGDLEVLRFTANGPEWMGWTVAGPNREFSTSEGWGAFSERDLVTPRGGFLVWDLWDTLRMAEVPVGGRSYNILDLSPGLPDLLALEDLDRDLEAGTVVVIGNLALVEVYADHLDPTEVDDWGLSARYVIVELSPQPKLGPGVRGAHFD